MDVKELALKNRILEVRVGSHLFGTDTPESDEDFVGIFMPWEGLLYGWQRCEEAKFDKVAKDETGRNTSEAIDRTIHEYRKFCRLALQNNPNILHMLFTNEQSIVFKDEHGFAGRLLGMREKFPHKGAHHRFVAYAHAQRHKMKIKPQNYAALESGLELLAGVDDHRVLADVVSMPVFNVKHPFTDNGKDKHVQCGDLFLERGVFVKKARKMIKERISKATGRTVLYTKYQYDTKFASNLIHLMKEGIDIMRTGVLEFPLPYAQEILDIKNGKYTVDEVEKWADELEEEARDAYENSTLRKEPLAKEIEAFVVREVKKYQNFCQN